MSNNKRQSGLKSFLPESAPRNGRMKGSRNKLGADFLYALQREFEQYGESVVRRARCDDAIGFLKVIASVLPKELEITDSRLRELSDAELDSVIGFIRGRLAGSVAKSDSGEEPTLN
jgi:hypothetical protein